MLRSKRIEALVVGAGPVGMFTALRLAQRGVSVRIIDGQWRTAARSYALALHPASLALLDEAGVATPLIAAGHQLTTVAFYDGARRCGALDLGRLETPFPFVLVVPQQRLEEALEARLKAAGVRVRWSHRLGALELGGGTARATVEKLVHDSVGYAVPEAGWVVGRRTTVEAAVVVGADGHRSAVRRALEVPFDAVAPPLSYGVFELDAGEQPFHEVRIALGAGAGDDPGVGDGPGTADVLWPLAGGRRRLSLQLDAAAEAGLALRDRHKSRVAVQVGSAAFPHLDEAALAALLADRAPWLATPARDLSWSLAVRFERRLAGRFGAGAAWLVGDAAHLASPIGVHSMNVGLREADDLAGRVARLLRGAATAASLAAYDRAWRREWRDLLAEGAGLVATPAAADWVRRHAARIPSCIPASGAQLDALLRQIGLERQRAA